MKRKGNADETRYETQMKRDETPERRGDVETKRRSVPTDSSSPTERAAAAAPYEETPEERDDRVVEAFSRNRSVAELGALTWATYAPDRGDERAIAGVRVRSFVSEGIEPELVLAALATWARGRDRTGEPYHAIGFTSEVCRTRVARLRELAYEKAKTARDAGDVGALAPKVDRGLVGVGDAIERLLRDVAKRVGP